MPNRIETIKRRLTESRQRLNAVLDHVEERWETPVYSEGAAWNIHQLAIHLALSEKGLANQAIGIAEGREVIPADFDLERYNRRSVEKRAHKAVEEIREDLVTARQDLLAWLDGIDDEAVLDRSGRHASLRIMTAGEILLEMADHEMMHANDIALVLGID
ncbi:MAG: DinB family protein [Chloroflexi bacterium]|nr:DinB family protein [Chloroflexota bacterium]